MVKLSAMFSGIENLAEDCNKKGLLFEPSNMPIAKVNDEVNNLKGHQ